MKLMRPTLHVRDTINLWLTTSALSKYLFKQNRSVLFNRAVMRALINYYNGDEGHQTNVATGNIGFGFMHLALILNTKPKRILCIGSRKGFIPALCAIACAENGFGHVDFVDAGYGLENTNHWSGIAWWKRVDPVKHFSFLDVNKTLTPYIMTTGEFAKTYPKQKYDYIYIDGEHSFEGVQTDYCLFWPRLSKNGFMVFHDVHVHQTKQLGKFGVWKLWKQLSIKNAISFPFPKESGLGIVQKK